MSLDPSVYEKLGAFYLGRPVDPAGAPAPAAPGDEPLLYDSKDLTTHAVVIGMTGSGKTGLGISLLEEAALDGVPSLVIDPKGDLGNLLLTFPDLAPADFEPWVDSAEAERQGVAPAEFAAAQAALWRKGLAAWGQDGARIARLRAAAEFAVYTPGSESGRPVSVLASFAAPPAEVLADGDLLRERIATTVRGLLGLVGIDADPVKSREHILLATLFDQAWRAGRGLDLGALIALVQQPPLERVGVLPLEAFYPEKERFGLAMALNNLLASPGFGAWLAGEALDVDRLLYDPSGRPRVAIFSIAHLGDAERMFFVTLLLNQVLGWVRGRPGTSSLRALVYMDEVFGFLPPVADPPSKRPLLTLLKQARAFGVGMVLATQNPVDLDYKALANIGTWFLGRLQTERDKARVLDGLEGAAAGSAFDRASMDRLLSGLGKRVFLLHNVHEQEPELFETRWAMSYLRGPITRLELARLAGARVSGSAAGPGGAAGASAATQAPAAASAAAAGAEQTSRPVLPPGVEQRFLPLRGRPDDDVAYRPALAGFARLHWSDAKTGVDTTEDVSLLALLGDGGPDWYTAEPLAVGRDELEREPAGALRFAPLPAAAGQARSYAGWEKEFGDALFRSRRLELWKSAELKVASQPGESERDFRIRLAEAAREARDRATEELRDRYGKKLATLAERRLRVEQRLEREKAEASQRKLDTAMSVGATVLGVLFGRRRLSSSTLSRAGSAARSVGRTFKEGQDVGRVEDELEAVAAQTAGLEAELKAEIDALAARLDPAAIPLETAALKPRRTDVEVQLVALAWAPYRRAPGGHVEPSW